MHILFVLVGQIPATFWGVVAGSFFTLLGVFFTNRSNTKRLNIQLSHDRTLKEKEREMTFRKDIYLATAEAVSVAINTVSQFGDLSIPQQQLTARYIDKAPAIAKAHLVAKEKMVKALADLLTEFSGTFLRLTNERIPLLLLQEQIAQKNNEINGYGRMRDGMLELMRQHRIENNQDEGRFKTIEQFFTFEAERTTKAISDLDQLTDELRSRLVPYVRTCFSEAMRINAFVPAALIAAREELELSIDIDAYAEIVKHAQEKTNRQMEQFLQNIAKQEQK